MGQEQVLVGGLVTHIYRAQNRHEAPKALLVLAHGRGRDYKSTEELALKVCESVPQCVCATYDQPNHGTRLINKAQNSGWKSGNKHHFSQMLAAIEQSASEVTTILQFLPAYLPELHGVKHLVSGISLGGHITWYVGAKGIADGIAPIIGCPNLPDMFRERAAKQDSFEAHEILPTVVMDLATRRKEEIAALRESGTPILALCGKEDTLVPARFTENFFASDRQKNHGLIIETGAGHEVTPAMVTKLCEWVSSQII